MAAINNPARRNLAIIGPASYLWLPALLDARRSAHGKSAGRVGRLTLKIDYRKH
jgi:hypothetical protein